MPPVVGRYYHNSAYVGCRTARPDNRHKWVEQPKARDWDRTDWIAAHWIIISKWKGLFTGRLPTVIWCKRYLKTDHNSLWRMELFDNFSSFIIKKRLTTSTERESYALLYVCLFFLFVSLLVCLCVTYITEKRTQAFLCFHKKPGMTQETIWNIFGCYIFPMETKSVCVCVRVRVCVCVCVWRGLSCLLAKLRKWM